jgi:cytochrome c oxidase subunit 2
MVSKKRALEIFWTSVTAIVLAYLGIVSAISLYNVDVAPQGTTHIKVIAQQFFWTFEYANGTQVIGELRVKAGEVVILDVESKDVAHSLFIYEMGVKIDAIPGHVNTFWFKADKPGTYTIVCAEFCGVSHYLMRARLIVEP